MKTVLPIGNVHLRALFRLLLPIACVSPSLARAQTPNTPSTTSLPVSARASQDSAWITRALAQIRDRVIAENPAGEIARANRQRALARTNAAGQAAPLTFSAGLSEAPIATLDQGNLRAEVGRDFRTGGRRRAERELVSVDVREADIDIAIAARSASAEALQSAITAAALARIAARLSDEDAMLNGADETVRARFSTGDARYVDVLRLRTERLHVQSDRSATLADERLSRAGLHAQVKTVSRTATNATVDSLAALPLEDLWRALLPDLRNARVVDSLLQFTPDEMHAPVEESRALAERAMLVADQQSKVNGYAGLQRIGQANNGPTIGPSVGFTMSLPFTAARGNTLALQAADASIATLRSTRALARETARTRLEAALEHYAAQRMRLETFDAVLLRGAREERESALSSYRTGELSLTELLDFERAISRAEVERLRALIDAVDAFTAITRDADGSETTKHIARSER